MWVKTEAEKKAILSQEVAMHTMVNLFFHYPTTAKCKQTVFKHLSPILEH